ncbi:MAG: hypothetical protein HWN68_00030 [Desulfobacterales bacterium]|nr:hypothetical protein [Desulfobacterales bacterium]
MLETLQTIGNLIEAFSARGLRKVTKEDTSSISKVPFKLISLRELYQYRLVDVSRAAYEQYEHGKYIPAFILTRAVMETVAMFYVCYEKLSKTLNTGVIDTTDDFLMQALFGSRDGTGTVKHYNALTEVQHVGKRSKAFEELYFSLCEFTHPNWAGVYLPYGDSREQGCLNLTSGVDAVMAEPIGTKPLLASLMLFHELYQDLIKSFLNLLGFVSRINSIQNSYLIHLPANPSLELDGS